MQVIEAQCSRSWRLTITLHIKHERALRPRPLAMVESGSLSPTGHVTAGATAASHPLRFQPRPMSPLQPATEGRAPCGLYARAGIAPSPRLQPRRHRFRIKQIPACSLRPDHRTDVRRCRAVPSPGNTHQPPQAARSPPSPQQWACLPGGETAPAIKRSSVLHSKQASDLEPPYGIEP